MLLELDTKQRSLTILATVLIGFGLSAFFRNIPQICVICLLITTYLITGDRVTSLYAIITTIPRDVVAAYRFISMNHIVSSYEKKKWIVPRVFQQFLLKHPQKMAFIMSDQQMTFQEIEDFSNKVGSYFKAKGFKRGDSIALILETCCEYSCIWMGLSKIGVVTALINTNLRKDTLVHSIKAANAKAIIFGWEMYQAIDDILDVPEISEISLYQFSDEKQRINSNFKLLKNSIDLTIEMENHKTQDLTGDMAEGRPRDKLIYVYTSGTTGMPKAAVITHLRYMFMGAGVHRMLAIRNDDIIYNSLPLYHTAGGILGVANVLLFGGTMVLRKKFSASNFWSDCVKYNCTVAQYIGELCRYLLSTPARADDTKHSIRLMFGNGLRPQIWSQFVARFNVPQIGELYGSTEGNSNLANIDNQVGAIGFVPILGERLYPVTLILCDEETGDPIPAPNGHCVKCHPGEPGILIGKVNPKRAVNAFSGYADRQASEKKLLRNVFVKGDVYFNSGDILVSDILGYYYFKDRIGDTFRWRGENVATSEVEAIITNVIGLQDCVVYGVDIPHVEGKAGMAAIVDPDHKVDLESLSAGIRANLPPYARPLFIRLLDEMPKTATFKLKKRDLMLDGFDITKLQDAIYFMNQDGMYRRLTRDQLDQLQNGTARL